MPTSISQVIETRRSVRAYLHRKPDRALVEKIIRAATLAPTACNMQLHEFIYIDDDEQLSRLARIATKKIRWAPSCIVVIYDKRFTRERHANLQSVAAAIQNMLLAAAAHGLATCWMCGFTNDSEIRELLGIPKWFSLAALITVGYPDGTKIPPRPYRSDVSEVVHWNSYRDKRPHLPTSADVDKWSIEQLVEYRKRIAPVYGYRFHLSPFHYNSFLTAFNIFVDRIIPLLNMEKRIRILDAVTYDGTFAKLMYEKLEFRNELTSSDYFEFPSENLTFAGVRTREMLIRYDHQIPGPVDSEFDIISCVHKIEYTTKPGELFNSWYKVSKPGGFLYLTTTDPYSALALVRHLLVLRPRSNAYENNSSYRIGPFHFRKRKHVENWLKQAGWRIRDSGRVSASYSGVGSDLGHGQYSAKKLILSHRFYWWVAECLK